MINSEFKDNWLRIKQQVEKSTLSANRKPEDVRIIAVSKTHPSEIIKLALDSGIRVFGENYAQELIQKASELEDYPLKPDWHFIGHLQTNKVKYIVPIVKMIHSVDSLRLAEEISRQAQKHNKTIEILLQVNTSLEESKYGCNPEEAEELAEKIQFLDNIYLTGLMTIGTFSDDEKISRAEFQLLRNLCEKINNKISQAKFYNLSMGMSHDFSIAIQEGSTFVRIGTSIFGNRDYTK